MPDLARNNVLQMGGIAASSAAIRTRRSFLGVSAAAVAGASLRPTLALPDPKVVIGVNHNNFPEFTRAIPGACGVRLYVDEYNLIPRTWPKNLPSATSLFGGPLIPPGTHTVMSIRPMPADLLTGKLDERIRQLARSAPLGSALTVWHENQPGNPMGYPREVNNASASRRMHEYVHRLCRNTNAAYGGSIICDSADQMMPWLGRRLDWYGLDIYAVRRYRHRDGTVDPWQFSFRMQNNLRAWRQLSGRKHPVVKICETNSWNDRIRSAWFTLIAGWLAAHNGDAMMTFWHPEHLGVLSGPWPPGEGVKDTLQALTRRYGTRRW